MCGMSLSHSVDGGEEDGIDDGADGEDARGYCGGREGDGYQ